MGGNLRFYRKRNDCHWIKKKEDRIVEVDEKVEMFLKEALKPKK